MGAEADVSSDGRHSSRKPTRLNDPSPLRGANGIAFGPDGLLYVAQFLRGGISAVDTTSGAVEDVVPPGGPMRTPDDLVFDAHGNMYVTDVVPGRVWRRTPRGECAVVAEDLRNPNGVARLGERLFVSEMRAGGELLELFPGGGEPVRITGGLNYGNALQCGPDGWLYYPHMMTNQVWRISPDGGEPEVVTEDVVLPVAVRFDRAGQLLVLSCGPEGAVTRVDPATGRTSSFTTGVPGLDNAAFDADNRMFVSSFVQGSITCLDEDGRTSTVVPGGLNGPFGVTADRGGKVYLADHFSLGTLTDSGEVAPVEVVTGDLPSVVRNVVATGDLLQLVTATGELHAYNPGDGSSRRRARGLGAPTGIAADSGGRVVLAIPETGRVLAVDEADEVTELAAGLKHPVGVALDGDGNCYVGEEHTGRVLRLADEPVVVAEGFGRPQGIAVSGGALFVLEVERGRLVRCCPATGASRTAQELDVGSLSGVDSAESGGRPAASDRPRPFADLAVAPDGSLLIATDGLVGVLRPSP
ncbi:hypothetical protein [Actinopolyspora saharensis]|uniref:hypothetical protein n=1 Tax=Actinopolyspora saharensis TaxID=995062 RepID=UPI000B81FC35|nr:hypothetical protein [Actinopolyspora saharensis]